MSLKLALLASGSGTNVQSIIDKARAGILDASIGVVFCNRPGARVMERAKSAGIPCEALDHREYPDRAAFDRAVLEILSGYGCQAAALAGYMRIVTPAFIEFFGGRVLNIHPALLPSFPGVHGALDALDYGCRITGPTVHFVEQCMDSGPIIIQAAVPLNVEEDLEALRERIQIMERRIYPQALQWLAKDRLTIEGRRVFLAPGGGKRAPVNGDWLVWPPLEEGF